jgi:DNA-binding GntR family transcriptional regulator
VLDIKQDPPGGSESGDRAADARPRGRGTRESLVDRAYREIRRRILDNHYGPGHQVLELELAADLGMSRTPIREALVRLQNERFVQIIPRHGMRVVPMSVQDLREVYEVVTALELAAIERLTRIKLEDHNFSAIEDALDEMDQALKKSDLDAWNQADERFHWMLVVLCGNARLADMVDTVWDQGHRARMTTVQLRDSLDQSNREHRALVRAVRRGDAKVACALHAKHRARTTDEMIRILQQAKLASF